MTKKVLKQIFPWVGGKRIVRKTLMKYIPEDPEVYVEPFLGSGTILLALQPRRAIVNDINPWLTMLWHICSHHIDEVKRFAEHKDDTRELYEKCLKEFNEMAPVLQHEIPRKWHSQQPCSCSTELVKASIQYYFLQRMTFGARSCFRKDGTLQASYGQVMRAKHLYYTPNYQKVHEYLRSSDITFTVGCYTEVRVPKNAFMYLDPPYCSYNSRNVTVYGRTINQEEVAKWAKSHGVPFVQSNMWTENIKELYSDCSLYPFEVKRSLVNSVTAKRDNEAIIVYVPKE